MNPSTTPYASGPILFWIRPDGRILNASEASCRWLGYALEELTRLNIWDITPDFPSDRWPEHWSKLRSAGSLNFPGCHRHRNGTLSEVEVFAQYFALDGIECASAAAYPLSLEQRAERALRESEARLTLTLEVSGQAPYELDLVTGRISLSEGCALMLELPPDSLEADVETWTSWLHPDDRETILELYQACVCGQGFEFRDVDYRVRTRSGHFRWVRSAGRIVDRNEAGRPLRLLGTHLDITAHKEAEKVLRLTKIAVDRAAIGIHWFDAEGRVIDVNEESCRSLGYRREELIGVRPAFFDPDYEIERYAQLWQELKRSGSLGFATCHRRKDGTIIHVEVNCNYIAVEDKEYNVTFTRDITAKKAAETRLRHHLNSEKTIADVSALMIKPGWNDLDARLDLILERVGSLADAARSFLIEIRKDDQRASDIHEWCNLGISPPIDRLHDLSLSDIPAFHERLQQGEVVEIETLAPGEEKLFKSLLLEPGLHRLICIPVRWDDRLRGLLGLEVRGHDRHWSEEDVRLLRLVGEILAHTLQRREADLALRDQTARLKDSEARYRAIFDNALDAIIVHDLEGRILAVNQAMLDIYGLGHAEALECTINELSPPEIPEPELRALCERALAGERIRFEWTARRPRTGGLFPVEVTLRAIRFDDRQALLANVRDISERKQAEETLRESEERFATAFRCSPAPTAITDLETSRFIEVNDRWLSMTGFARKDMIGRTTAEFGHVADRSLLGPAFEEIATNGMVLDYPVPVILKNGEHRDYLWSAQKILLQGREVLLASVQDVTERNRALAALSQSEERFAKAFQSSPAAMTVTTIAEGRIIDVNERWLRLLGFSREDMIGRTTKQIGIWENPADRDRMITQLGETGPFQDAPIVFLTADGERREILWSTEIITLGGDPVLLSSVHDLTAQKRAERALQESEVRLRAAVENIPFDFYLLDAKRRFVLQNRVSKARMGDLTGLLSSQLPADQDLIDHFEGMLDHALSGGLVDQETPLRIFEEERHVHDVIAPIKDGDAVRGVVGLSIDITERRRAESELRQYREHLEELVQERTEALEQAMRQLVQAEKLAALGNLVAGVAHELNTPLGNARMVSSTLSEQIRTLDSALNAGALRRSQLKEFLKSSREAIELLERNTIRAADLIRHFKEVAVDQTSVRRRCFNLRVTIDEVLATMRPILKRTTHRVELDISPDMVLDSYPGPLEQVIANLLHNSLTHGFADMENGRIQVQAYSDDATSIQLTYQDDGAGIPMEDQARIFEPFFTTRLGQGGSGLGLYIVYNLITSVLGGRISVSSKAGEGTRFDLWLPRNAPEQAMPTELDSSGMASVPGYRNVYDPR